MAARAYWQGQIRLALVSIPVQVFPATKTAARISFNQIHKPTGKRIRYEKVVPGVGPVEAEDIVKGYEVEKGKYVLLTDEEIDDVKLEAKRTIDLVQFVDEGEIDSIYFDKPYFIAPEEGDETGAEAYVVLREALKQTKKVGLGQLVLRGRSNIVAVKPYGKGLSIETLRYSDEVQKGDQFFTDVPEIKADKELVGLAEELIKRKASKFDPKAFKDSYEDALRELIDAKVENREPEAIEEPQLGAKVIDLMEALKRSVGNKKGASKIAAAKAEGPKKTGKAKAAKEAKAPAKRTRAA
ncbi:MAG: Ku protein [Rhizobiales bacterium]|nr:Ku protein [Hyphomicrobiales bacterium]MBN9009553.1 Ku protein [Hyphomicrobiales bacterium]